MSPPGESQGQYVTKDEFYRGLNELRKDIMERLDRLELDISNQHCRDIDRIERRIDSQDTATRIGALIGAVIAGAIGMIGWFTGNK